VDGLILHLVECGVSILQYTPMIQSFSWNRAEISKHEVNSMYFLNSYPVSKSASTKVNCFVLRKQWKWKMITKKYLDVNQEPYQ
jgi:hypothetical protein